jgi:phosphatidylethanolamine-binding protein (PEBP) family uncharacterized protein
MKYALFPMLFVASALACAEDPVPAAVDAGSGEPILGTGSFASETNDARAPSAPADSSSSAEAGVGAGSFTLWSPAFQAGDELPDQYTCEGKPFGGGHLPALRWDGAPTGTRSFALVFKDLTLSDQPQFAYHWAAWNIPSSVSNLPERLAAGQFPDALAGGEQFRAGPPHTNEFFGPCPSWTTHCFGEARSNDSYAFILYAFEDASLSPSAAREGENYVAALDAYFAARASAVTFLSAQSDAVPSSAPMCPSDGGTHDVSDAASPAEDSRVPDAGQSDPATIDSDAAPAASDTTAAEPSTDGTCSTRDTAKRGKRHHHPRHRRH